MEKLQARISIYKNDVLLAYLYNREAFDLLKIEKGQHDGSQFIVIGQKIEFNGENLKVVDINFRMEPELIKIDPNLGANVYSPNDPSDFNCQIHVFLENI